MAWPSDTRDRRKQAVAAERKPLRNYFGATGAEETSPTAQGSLLYDILNDLTVDAQIQPLSTDERAMAFLHIAQLTRIESFEEWKELIIFDRGYPSFELINELLDKKFQFLMRVRKKFSTKIDELNYGDHAITLEHGGVKTYVRVMTLHRASPAVSLALAIITAECRS